MFALVDCNNFFASCEKLFDPQLRNKPVVVLSNNDGCVIARSAEAKALGIKMGVPWFKIRGQAVRDGVIAKSSNYALYADMSNRAVQVLRDMAPRIEVYSIDESFLDLSGLGACINNAQHGRLIRQRMAQWVGLPVCVGIGPTKTLAKLANHIAKTTPTLDGVCDLSAMAAHTVDQLFSTLEVNEVWGVGRKLSASLQRMQIHTVADLRKADPQMIRQRFSVVLERTVKELQGISCLALDDVDHERQQIICSRSFGRPVTTYEDMAEAVATYISRAVEKLRSDKSQARALTIWIESNFYNAAAPQNSCSLTLPLPAPSSDSRQLTRVGLWMLKRMYRDGVQYRKAGCILSDISPVVGMQQSLFINHDGDKVMAMMDAINARFGRGTVQSAAEGFAKTWQMKRDKISPRYTTDWNGLMPVR